MATTGTFGRWLLDQLNKNDMTRGDLAEKLAVTEQTIYAWIKSKAKPTDDKLDMIVDLFNADRAEVYFLAGKGYAAVEYESLSPQMANLAIEIQSRLDAIKDPRVRKLAEDELASYLGKWIDGIERINDFLDGLIPSRK